MNVYRYAGNYCRVLFMMYICSLSSAGPDELIGQGYYASTDAYYNAYYNSFPTGEHLAMSRIYNHHGMTFVPIDQLILKEYDHIITVGVVTLLNGYNHPERGFSYDFIWGVPYGFRTGSTRPPTLFVVSDVELGGSGNFDCGIGNKKAYIETCVTVYEGTISEGRSCESAWTEWVILRSGPSGTVFDLQKRCAACDPGSWGDGHVCWMCQPGTYTHTQQSHGCNPCPANTFQNWFMQTSCIPCPLNTFSSIGSRYLSQCLYPPLCSPGTFSSTGRQPTMYTPCQRCFLHASSHIGATTCTPCTAGTAAPISYNIDTSDPFYNGMAAFSVQEIWSKLMYWSQNNIISGNVGCENCQFSKTSIAGQPCQCEPGYFERNVEVSTNIITSKCFPCKLHSYSAEIGTSTCIVCPVGKQTLAVRATECVDCPANSGTDDLRFQEGCFCQIGYFPEYNTANVVIECTRIPHCYACLPGTYMAPQSEPPPPEPCLPCPENTWSAMASGNITECQCNAGYALQGGACTACEAGKYKSATSGPACVGCPENTYSAPGSSSLDACVCNPGWTG